MALEALRRPLLAALLVAAGCVPTEFTFVGEGGGASGPGGAGAGGQGAGGAGAAGGGEGGAGAACGDGVAQAGEGCDLGEANSDDLDDVGYATQQDPERGCSTACQPIVEWSWSYSSEPVASAIFGLAVTGGRVYAGGVINDDPLNLVDVHYGGTRLYVELDQGSGDELHVVSTNDAADQYNSIFGVRARDDGSVWLLENIHDPNGSPASLGSYLVAWSDGAELPGTRTTYVGEYQGSFAYLGYPGYSDPRVHMIASRDSGIVRIARGSEGSVEIDEGLTGFGGQSGPGAITPRLVGGSYAAWRSRLRLYSDDIDVQFEQDLQSTVPGSEVVMVTGACTRPDGSAAFSAWARYPSGDITAAVLVADEFEGVVFVDEWDGPGPGIDRAHAVACADDGSFVVVGEESVPLDAATNSDVYSRAFARRYSASADGDPPALAWHRTHESPITNASATTSSTDAYAVAIGPEGAVYVAGREMTSQNGASAWVRRYAP